MPTYEVKTNLGTYQVQAPTDATDDELSAAIEQHLQTAPKSEEQKTQEASSWQALTLGASQVSVIAGMAAGAAKGTALGLSVGGPWGAVAGGLVGAGVGAATGQTVNEAVNLGSRVATGQPVESTQDVLSRVGQVGLQGVEAQTYGNILGPAAAFLLGKGDRLGYARQALGLTLPPPPGSPIDLARTTPQERITRTAQSMGVDLSAYEQSGRPFLRTWEAFASRSPTGAGQFVNLGQRQAAQLTGVGQDILDQFGPSLDVATRNNRFMTLLSAATEDAKKEGNRLFQQAYEAIGLDTATNADNLTAMVKKVMADRPTIRGEPVKGFGFGPPVDDILKKIAEPPASKAEQTLRTQLGIKADEPTPEYIKAQLGTDTAPALTVGELRKLQTALGPIAWPNRFEGAVVADSQTVRGARQIWSAIADDVEAVAAERSPAALAILEEAKQYWKNEVRGYDSEFYRQLLSGDKNLSSMNARLFNPRDPGMLIDAKKTVTDDGFKLIQQQYWDDVMRGVVKEGEGGLLGFDGRALAIRLAKDRTILDHLYDPETAQAIRDLGQVAATTSRTSLPRQNEVIGIMIGVGQAYGAMSGLGDIMSGRVGTGLSKVTGLALIPYAMGAIASNPTSAKVLANAFRTGTLSPETANALVRYAIMVGKSSPRGASAPAEPPPPGTVEVSPMAQEAAR